MNIAGVCSAILALMTGCDPVVPPMVKDASPSIVDAATDAPEVDLDAVEYTTPEPCGRTTTIVITWDGGWRATAVPLPCRPFDPARDLPYPQP